MGDYRLNGINNDYDGISRLSEGSVVRYNGLLHVGIGGNTFVKGRGSIDVGRALDLARENETISLAQQAKLYKQVREFVLSEPIIGTDLEGLSPEVQKMFREGIRGFGTTGK
jgi:hypothetical protein